MPRRLSEKSKMKMHLGEGFGKNYKPYISTSEFNSSGTTSVIVDWKTGRGVHCLSQAEAYWFYILRWNDENIDIREQYPLCYEDTVKIANENGIKHPRNGKMTTDFFVTKKGGKFCAYSIKAGRKSMDTRTIEKLYLEKLYWANKGVPYKLLFKEDLNVVLVQNIRQVITYYDFEKVFDEMSLLKHKIAIKEIKVDMESPIDFHLILSVLSEGEVK